MKLNVEVSLLCIIVVFIPAALTEDEVALTVSTSQQPLCGEPLTLTCRMTPLQGPTVIQMTWNKKDAHMLLCNQEGKNPGSSDTFGDFACTYSAENATLTLTMQKMKSVNVGEYLCKLHTDSGTAQELIKVEFPECCKGIRVSYTEGEGPVCNFMGVHPDVYWDVHWYQGSRRLSENTTINTRHYIEEGLTIKSKLALGNQLGKDTYNCSLWNAQSQHYMCSRLVDPTKVDRTEKIISREPGGAATETMRLNWHLWGFPLLLTYFVMKL